MKYNAFSPLLWNSIERSGFCYGRVKKSSFGVLMKEFGRLQIIYTLYYGLNNKSLVLVALKLSDSRVERR